MLEHLKKHWHTWVITALFLLILCWIAITSDAFQECINQQHQQASPHKFEERISNIFGTLRRTKSCAGYFLKEDGDAITAFFTLVLSISTIAWLSTRELWRVTDLTLKHSEDTAQRQLRAYIGHEPNGARFEKFVSQQEIGSKVRQVVRFGRLVYFEKNHGLTPAYNVRMYICVTDKPPAPYNGPFEQIPVMQMIHPQQNIGKILANQTQTADKDFFLYGYVDYDDCFGRKWRRIFAVGPDLRDDEWIAHHEHNDEFERKGNGPWPT